MSEGTLVLFDGDGVPAFDESIDRVVMVVPAHRVVIHHSVLPDLTDAQARAAGRLLVAEQSVSPIDTLHVAVGPPNAAGDRTVVAVEAVDMVQWLGDLAAQGVDPDAMIAAPLLLPRPDEGFVRAKVGGEWIVRGRDAAFADDDVLTPLLTGGSVTTLDNPDFDARIAEPEVDLRQGMFAKRRRWGIDWALVRRIGWLALAVAVATLILQIVIIARLNAAADRIEAASAVEARSVLPPGSALNNPVIQVQERLAAIRGPGGGFLPLAAAIGSAANATPDVEITSMIFDGGGSLRINARAATPADLSAFEARLNAGGLKTVSGAITVNQGRQLRDYTVQVR